MNKGFFENTHSLNVATYDGRNFSLSEFLIYRDSLGNRWRTQTQTDGLSTPRIIWFIIPPFGKLWYSGVLHDGAYRDNLQRWNMVKEVWEKSTVKERFANWLIHDAMNAQGGSWLEHTVISIALRLFGWRAFDEDRNKK